MKLFKFLNNEGTLVKKHLFYAIFICIFFHLLAAFLSEGFHRPDEHLGIIRFIQFKLDKFPIEGLSWEYPAKIRPWLQPAIYFVQTLILQFLGVESPFILAFWYRLLSALLALASFYYLLKLAVKNILTSDQSKIVMGYFLSLLWFFPFIHARTTSENFSSSFFIFGIYVLCRNLSKDLLTSNILRFRERKSVSISLHDWFFAAVLFGLSFIFRFQMIIMIAGVYGWLFLKLKLNIKPYLYTFLGLLITLIISTIIDYWGYGVWTFTPWNYFYYNIFLGKASSFGHAPFWYYLEKSFFKGTPPLSLFIVLPFLFEWIKRPFSFLTFITLPFLLVHSIIGHKELRFIFVLGSFLPLIVSIWIDQYHGKFSSKFILFLKFCALQNLILLIISSTRPALGTLDFYKHLYNKKENISTIYSLNVVRDKLDFYLKAPLTFNHVDNIEEAFKRLKESQKYGYILTDKINDYRSLLENKNCKLDYTSYPSWILKFNPFNWQERSKLWSMFYCN